MRVAREAAREVGERARLVGVKSPSGSVTVAVDVARLALRHDVGRAPGVEARGVAAPAAARRPGLSGFSSVTCRSARNAVQRSIGAQLGALFEHQALELLDAELLDHELEARARRGSSFSPRRANTRHTACAIGSSSSSGTNSSNSCAVLRHRAEAAADVELEAALHLAVDDARARDAPMSWKLVRPHGVVLAARERDLELAAEVLGVVVAEQEERDRVGVRRRRRTPRSWQTPAYGQAVTLRTELPHASRVVMPTAASRRIRSGVSSMWTKCSWMSWRVVTCRMRSEYSSASSASTSSCVGGQLARTGS